MPPSTQDNAALSETLDEARELDSVIKDAQAALKPLRELAHHLVKAGKCSDAQRKATETLFPPKGRAVKKK